VALVAVSVAVAGLALEGVFTGIAAPLLLREPRRTGVAVHALISRQVSLKLKKTLTNLAEKLNI
jgi:hypothetical protein